MLWTPRNVTNGTIGDVGYGTSESPHVRYDAPSYNSVGAAFTWLVLARRYGNAVFLSRAVTGGSTSRGVYLYTDGPFYFYRSTGEGTYFQIYSALDLSAETDWCWYLAQIDASGNGRIALARVADVGARRWRGDTTGFMGTGYAVAEDGTTFYQHRAPNSVSGSTVWDNGAQMSVALTMVFPWVLSNPELFSAMREPVAWQRRSLLWADYSLINRGRQDRIRRGERRVNIRNRPFSPSLVQSRLPLSGILPASRYTSVTMTVRARALPPIVAPLNPVLPLAR